MRLTTCSSLQSTYPMDAYAWHNSCSVSIEHRYDYKHTTWQPISFMELTTLTYIEFEYALAHHGMADRIT